MFVVCLDRGPKDPIYGARSPRIVGEKLGESPETCHAMDSGFGMIRLLPQNTQVNKHIAMDIWTMSEDQCPIEKL